MEKKKERMANCCDSGSSSSKTCLGSRWCYRYDRPTGMRLLLLAALLFTTLTTGNANSINSGIRLVKRLSAPPIVDPRADKVNLTCDYDLRDLQLYSVTWYRNDETLFKYTPSSAGQFFPISELDLKVSLEMSNSKQLVLVGDPDFRKNKRAYEGTYICEVATEQPFYSDYAMTNITTAILPKSNPVIDGLAPNYNVGEQLDATCTAAPSLPPADLTFHLNGRKISERSSQLTRGEKTLHSIGDATTSSRLSVSLRLEPQHFISGSLSLSCRATLPGVPVVGDYRGHYNTEKSATFGATNQRFAQEEPPKMSLSAAGRLETPLALSSILALVGVVRAIRAVCANTADTLL